MSNNKIKPANILQMDSCYLSDELITLAKKKGETENAIKLTFKNLTYEVEVKQDVETYKKLNNGSTKFKVIKDVSGYAMPG